MKPLLPSLSCQCLLSGCLSFWHVVNLKIHFRRKVLLFFSFYPSYFLRFLFLFKTFAYHFVCVMCRWMCYGRESTCARQRPEEDVKCLPVSLPVYMYICAPESWPMANCGTQTLTQDASNHSPSPQIAIHLERKQALPIITTQVSQPENKWAS